MFIFPAAAFGAKSVGLCAKLTKWVKKKRNAIIIFCFIRIGCVLGLLVYFILQISGIISKGGIQIL